MAIEESNKHMIAMIDNMNEVDRLRQIHRQITTTGPGYKHDVQVLHKSAIVLLVACWESFVEDLAADALDSMIATAPNHKAFPKYVLERIGSAHSGMKVWNLAGDGWKQALRGNMKGVLNRTTSALNTPRTPQVDELFLKVIGLKDLSACWYWPGRSVKQTRDALDDLVTLRGSIAHRVKSSSNVTLKRVNDSREFIYRLSVRSHNRVHTYLTDQVGSSPWSKLIYGKTH